MTESVLDAVHIVGITGDKIADIIGEPMRGKETIDACGHLVASGFIDLQFHWQGPLRHEAYIREGVTWPLKIEAGHYEAWIFGSERSCATTCTNV